MNRRQLILLALLAAAVVAFFALDLGRFFSLGYVKSAQADFAALYAARPVAVIGAYFALYVAVTALSLPGAAVMTLAGGALFGFGVALVVVSFASSLGATLAMLVARYLLRDAVQARFGARLAEVDRGIERDGAFYLFTLRLVPVFPFFAINLLFGLTAMRAWTFYWVSQLGMLAGTAVYVNAGTQLAKLDSVAGIVSPGLLASFALLGVFPLLAKKAVEAAKRRRVYARWADRRPRRFDRNLVVIGAGAAGLVASYVAAAVKAKVTLVEAHRMGGDCLNTGCVPSKALLRTAKLLHEVRHARALGIAHAEARVDFADVMARVARVVREIEPHDSVERYTQLGVDVVRGHATIVDPWHVKIALHGGGEQVLSTRAIVIAAGARPHVPDLPGIEHIEVLTSDNLWELRELPPRLLVLGAGPVGCELAQAFARLGSAVTLVEQLPRLLAREDDDVAAFVRERLEADGVRVLAGHRALRVEAAGRDGDVLVVEHGGVEQRVPFDRLLCAVGRVARLEGYGLEALGIVTQRTIVTDEALRTVYPNILAAGDVAGPYQFTHVAAHQAWHAAVNALFGRFKRFAVDYAVIPWTTFVDPEVARVGLNEQEARARGVAFEVTRYGIDDLDRAIVDGKAQGWVKVLTAPARDRILGVTIVGAHAGELIAEYVLAMKHGIGLNKILGTIHAYPTFAEANKYAAGAWKRAHAPQRVLAWLERFHAWQRGGDAP
ncbi:FAD-dependent oxidoreductase [Calidifontimicrobium sp. SYSU G02091]|uniref:FAD-dependent oxidoreductase n=1 Tax=Calidifontimicrobium sp. SYSU G02091 TaxID=2926421 RepID=UPI001F52B90C|nr:bifunctional TVP38/TMEM64 family protein/FAD-dependent oxidoreductase [Calidifontimicrobium sp. SYSU G02091]MCI1192912.1 FAD-dependent oxidoreductase [Calidifontimicrobium sp. SYSU G02091]